MSDKREKILSAAKSLFIEQGVNGTTIAEIAKQAGIAKGSVYSYFKSKQDIVIALMNQMIERGQHQLEELMLSSEATQQALIEKYIAQELSLMSEERALNQAIAMDDSLMMNEDMVQLIQSYRSEYYQGQLKLLQSAYGEEVKTWQMDIIAIINGALHEYGLFMTLDNANINIFDCAKIIACCVDSTIKGLLEADLTPAIQGDSFEEINNSDSVNLAQVAQRFIDTIKLHAEQLTQKQQHEVTETCVLLEQALQSDEPNTIMLRALIANLAPYPELHKARIGLAGVLDVAVI